MKFLGFAVVACLAFTTVAKAQICFQPSRMTTRCRFLLSRPRTLLVTAAADMREARHPLPVLTLDIDHAPCRGRELRSRHELTARCNIKLQPTVHIIEAQVSGQASQLGAVRLAVSDNPGLAAIPREAKALWNNAPKSVRTRLSRP